MQFKEATKYRTNYCGTLSAEDVGSRVTVSGWVAKRREHGEHLAFVDLRDYTGIIQCVVDGSVDVRSEYVLSVTGTLSKRPEGTVNDKISTGEVELTDCEVEIISNSDTPPVPLDEYSYSEESARLKYRYIDIRNPRMQRNLRLRSAMNASLRQSMIEQGFVEVETPLLWTPTPEGAREFVVPSRRQVGSFYALPQSPQIAKQLLMVGGVDRYFQIARCLRDEDLRADRQFEFTQLDIEASFVDEIDVMGFISKALKKTVSDLLGIEDIDIEKITWLESMRSYGVDKPDLRYDLKIHDISEYFKDTEVNALKAESVQAIVVKGGAEFSRKRLDDLVKRAIELGAKGLLWLKVVPDGESISFDSPISKFLKEKDILGFKESLNLSASDLVLVISGQWRASVEVLGAIRSELGKELYLNSEAKGNNRELKFVWVTEFPLFDGLDDSGNPISAHHPFTMPHSQDLDLLETEPLKVRSSAYDLVCNGWELGSGSIRIHSREIQEKVFKSLGLSIQEAQEKFGFLLDAFKYGAPPHGGFAIGLDRLVALIAGEDSIREVIAFPKTQSGADLMTGAPGEISGLLMRELGIKFSKELHGGQRVKSEKEAFS